MPLLTAIKPFAIVQGSPFKLAAGLFTLDASVDSLDITVSGGLLYSGASALGVTARCTLADLKLGKISFVADGITMPAFSIAAVSGSSRSDEAAAPVSFKTVNQAPITASLGLGSESASLKNGGTLILDRSMITISDAETPDATNINLKVVKVSGGAFYLNGKIAKAFSLDDVEAGSVLFRHDGKGLKPSFSLQAVDSDGKAATATVANVAKVYFDAGIQGSGAFVMHALAGGQITLTEGATLKLTSAMLPVNALALNLAANAVDALVCRVDGSQNLVVKVAGVETDSFTIAQLKAGQVTIVHDGSQSGPRLDLSLLSGETVLDQIHLPFLFKTVNDLPTLSLSELDLGSASSQVLDTGLFEVADEETPLSLNGAFQFTVKSATGLEFHRSGQSAVITKFSYQEVEDGLISAHKTGASSASYTLAVSDPSGKTSAIAQGTVNLNAPTTPPPSTVQGLNISLKEGPEAVVGGDGDDSFFAYGSWLNSFDRIYGGKGQDTLYYENYRDLKQSDYVVTPYASSVEALEITSGPVSDGYWYTANLSLARMADTKEIRVHNGYAHVTEALDLRKVSIENGELQLAISGRQIDRANDAFDFEVSGECSLGLSLASDVFGKYSNYKIETLNISANEKPSSISIGGEVLSSLNLINLSGDAKIQLSGVFFEELDASGMTGAVEMIHWNHNNVKISGGSGNDILFGSQGPKGDSEDQISGGAGDDVIRLGVYGHDLISGGVGRDLFAFLSHYGYSELTTDPLATITDFNAAEDRILSPDVVVHSVASYQFAGSTYSQFLENAKTSSYSANSANLLLNTTTQETYLLMNNSYTHIEAADLILNITGYTGTFSTANFVTSDINVH
ncbi:MAG: hypothetical protein RL095_1336 [Verrucomicrobiota bacterium]|jgi:hypothetical protein